MSDLSPVVSTEWLVAELDNPRVKVVDCRFQLADPDWGYQQYLSAHIRGAYFLDVNQDLSSPVQAQGGRHPLPDFEKLADKLGQMGINFGKTSVIVYDDARFAFASRLWWLLRYMGHEQVAWLDGGWKAWQSLGYPTSQDLPQAAPAQFMPSFQFDWIVHREAIQAKHNAKDVVLIDSRDGPRYRGEQEPIDPIAGHIPGAVNSPWQQVTDEKGYIQSLDFQQELWQAYPKDQEILVYCGSGITACVNLFSLFLLGYKNVKLYPGGWSDWCSYLNDLPI